MADNGVRRRGKAAIMAATTAEAAQMAYNDDRPGARSPAQQAATLMDLLEDQLAMIARLGRIEMQKRALMAAAGMIDTSDLSTQDLVDDAREAIVGLREALEAAVDVSEADKMMYMSTLDDAVDDVSMAQNGIDLATARTNQMTALSDASDELQAALAALSGSTPTQEQLDDANMALNALNAAISGSKDLTDTETAPYVREAANAMAPIEMAQTAFEDAEDDAEDAANAAMAVTASKLYAGISVPTVDGTTADTDTATGTRFAGYVTTAGTPTGASVGDIQVGIGDAANVALSEDDDAMVDDHHGWEGKMYTRTMPAAEGTYEAIVYSNVGESTEGRKFGSSTPGTGDDRAYEYMLNAMGILTADEADGVGGTGTTFVAARVGGSSFDHTAGSKEFELPDPNPQGVTRISFPGSYHGVDGTYTCTPGDAGSCTATVAAMGFTLGGTGTPVWTFTPGNASARVMSAPDMIYASYGWWIHKAANDGDFTASAFVANMGDVPAAANITALLGTATYMGGAAGKYALRSSTGGTNDAGHFTARAMLEADFGDDMITGTIDNFMGADGMARDWSVELNETDIGDTGVIDGVGGASNDVQVGTVWTIGGTDGDSGGQWSGALYDNDDGGVPGDGSNIPTTVTGTFYSDVQHGSAVWSARSARTSSRFAGRHQQPERGFAHRNPSSKALLGGAALPAPPLFFFAAPPLATAAARGHPRGTAARGGPPREREPADRRDDAGRRGAPVRAGRGSAATRSPCSAWRRGRRRFRSPTSSSRRGTRCRRRRRAWSRRCPSCG